MSDSNSIVVRFCKKCGRDTERHANGRCRPCRSNYSVKNAENIRAYQAEWNEKNADYKREKQREYYLENKESILAKGATYRAENPEKMQSFRDAWNENNKDRRRTSLKSWRVSNKEKMAALVKAWQEANPDRVKAIKEKHRSTEKFKETYRNYFAKNVEKIRAKNRAWIKNNREAANRIYHTRRAKKKEVGGKLSRGLSGKLFSLQRGKCACCGLPLGKNYHLDHIMPIALGGSNTDDNIQLLRALCNHQKGKKHPVDFMRERGGLL